MVIRIKRRGVDVTPKPSPDQVAAHERERDAIQRASVKDAARRAKFADVIPSECRCCKHVYVLPCHGDDLECENAQFMQSQRAMGEA